MCLSEGCLTIFATRDELGTHTSTNHSTDSVKKPSSVMVCTEDSVTVESGGSDHCDAEETLSTVIVDSNLGYQLSGMSRQLQINSATATNYSPSPPSSSSPLFATSASTLSRRRGHSREASRLEEGQTGTENPLSDRDIMNEGLVGSEAPLGKILVLDAVSPHSNTRASRRIAHDEGNKLNNGCTRNIDKNYVDSRKRVVDIISAKKKEGKAITEILKSSSGYSDSDSREDYSESESEDKSQNRTFRSTDGTEFFCPVSTCARSFSKVCALSLFDLFRIRLYFILYGVSWSR